jgi:hypothetical protein
LSPVNVFAHEFEAGWSARIFPVALPQWMTMELVVPHGGDWSSLYVTVKAASE